MAIRADADDLIAFLDSLAKLDPVCMGKLIAARVPCSQALAEHGSVQVAAGGDKGYASVHPGDSAVPPGEYRVGMLGILNGYAGVFDDGPKKGWGPITVVIEQDGRCTSVRKTDNV